MQSSSDHTLHTRPRDALRLLAVTYLVVRAFWMLSDVRGGLSDTFTFEALLKLVIWLPVCLFVVWKRASERSLGAELGLGTGAARGLAFGLVATIPMAVAVLVLPRTTFNPDLVAGSAIIGPFAEEVLFRGLLFTGLVRRAGWSVPAALIVSSAFFGLAHVRHVDIGLVIGYRGMWLSAILSYGLPYAMGGAVFAWVTYRWKSLWPAIGLHGFMNFWWDLTTGEHAQLVFRLDPLAAAQALSVIVAVCLTILWTRRAALVIHRPLSSP